MTKLAPSMLAITVFLLAPPVCAADLEPVPFQQFELNNGLKVIVSEDRTVPLVAVVVLYHVGSRHEESGQSGFAHLFEHLMFQGSENFQGEYFEPLREVGASNVNGFTTKDFTAYHQIVPTSGLETALWMESDRMGHLTGAITQELLDEQRGVVRNEKLGVDSAPLGTLEGRAMRALVPASHPYSWGTLGSMRDLAAADLDQVHSWFNRYYGAANASIVIVGDVTAENARALVEKYFGDIRPGPPIASLGAWIASPERTIRDHAFDHVQQPVIARWWIVPAWASQESALFELAREILAQGKNSRLNAELIERRKLATSAEVTHRGRELLSEFRLQVTAAPGVEADELSAALDETLAAFFADGPTPRELERAKARLGVAIVNGREDLLDRSLELAQGQVLARDPARVSKRHNWAQSATVGDIREVVQRWLDAPHYQLTATPFPSYQASGTGVDRSSLPAVRPTTELDFPAPQTFTLTNGIEVVLVERPAVPLFRIGAQFDGGAASGGPESPGLAGFTLDMLDEGSDVMSAEDIADAIGQLGGTLATAVNDDAVSVDLTVLSGNTEPAVALFADMVRNPSFREDDIARVRGLRLGQLAVAKADQIESLRYYLPVVFYGRDHPYGQKLLGLGTAGAIESIEREQLVSYHAQWITPTNVTLFVVGDASRDGVEPLLEDAFGSWNATGVASTHSDARTPPTAPGVVLVDMPHASQTVIVAGRVLGDLPIEEHPSLFVFNDLISGQFMSRLNLNLREEKGWSYGCRSMVMPARGSSLWFVFTAVQSDKSVQSIEEIVKELGEALTTRPITGAEVATSRDTWSAQVLSRLQNSRNLLDDLLENRRLGRDDRYNQWFADRIGTLTREQVQGTAARVLARNELSWLIVGDLQSIETEIRELDLGPIEVWPSLEHGLQN